VTLKRSDEVERFEQKILNRYLNRNRKNQTENINSMLDFLQNHYYEESSEEYIQLMCDRLCSFDVTTTSENRTSAMNKNEQSMSKEEIVMYLTLFRFSIGTSIAAIVSTASSTTQQMITKDDGKVKFSSCEVS